MLRKYYKEGASVVTHFWVPMKNKINSQKRLENNRGQKRSENSQKIGQGI